MPMPPKGPPPPELISKQLREQLRITELELEKANETVRTQWRVIHNLQWQVESLQAQNSECNGDGIHAHDENAAGVRGFDEDVECHDEGCDGKIFGDPGSGERSGSVADPPKRKPKRKRRCEVYDGGAIPAAGSDYKRSSLTRGPAFTGHGLRICDGLS